jgi:hypothetical protein
MGWCVRSIVSQLLEKSSASAESPQI